MLLKTRGGSKDFQKRGEGVLYISHHGWIAKKILAFTWSKKAKITPETISLSQNTLISIFKFSPFYIQWRLANDIYKRFDKKTEETLIEQSMRKEKLRIARLCFIVGCFIKSFKLIINQFFFVSQAHLQRSFCFLLSEWRKKHQKGKLGTTNSYW